LAQRQVEGGGRLTATYIVLLLVTGAGAGFASGMLGVGAGSIMVPVIYWVITDMGVSPDIAIRVAFGTSLLVILPTATSGAWRHNRNGAVHWKVALVLGSSGLVGALAGSTLASYLPGNVLEIGLGGLLLAAALWVGLRQRIMSKPGKERGAGVDFLIKDARWLSAVCGFPIGIVVGLSGLGGGVLMVPVLVLIFHFPIHLAIGTSLASIAFTSLGGIIGYILHGIGTSPLPYSIGYINVLVWLCLVATSSPLAQLGAKATHALPAKYLHYLFITFVVYAGFRMIGVF